MSLEASIHAWKTTPPRTSQPTRKSARSIPSRSSQKFVLVAMASRAGENALCWPSIARLASDTLLDRKTVQAVLEQLIKNGLIEDTGERRGATKQVRVFRICGVIHREDQEGTDVSKQPKNGTVKTGKKSQNNQPKNGMVKAAQKRNHSENGTVPNFPTNDPNIPIKGSQFGDTESIRNLSRTTDTDTEFQNEKNDHDSREKFDLFGVGFLGSKRLKHHHPFIYSFIQEQEARIDNNPASRKTFIKRFAELGLSSSYCAEMLKNYLTTHDVKLVNRIKTTHGLERAQAVVADWNENATELLSSADDMLSDVRHEILRAKAWEQL